VCKYTKKYKLKTNSKKIIHVLVLFIALFFVSQFVTKSEIIENLDFESFLQDFRNGESYTEFGFDISAFWRHNKS